MLSPPSYYQSSPDAPSTLVPQDPFSSTPRPAPQFYVFAISCSLKSQPLSRTVVSPSQGSNCGFSYALE
ncbi:hypothetical protein IQ07DRAFT_593076 [Pyrenochaeta sp. DS3sAY3a]|nr:hypothetical protein IQ07DRAFT_593076 [Pyrenochaeta sp. DS3sAY3a]